MAEVQLTPGVDVNDPQVKEAISKRLAEMEQAATPQELVELEDLQQDHQEIAGFRCRPLSAGLLAMFAAMKSPLFSGDLTGGESDLDLLPDAMALIYALLCDLSEAELVSLAFKGYEAFKQEALVWAFALSVGQMAELQNALPALVQQMTGAVELYTGKTGEDEAKKK